MNDLRKLIEENEGRLLESISGYAKKQGLTEHTSTRQEDWRLSIAELSSALLAASRHYPNAPELGWNDSCADDPLTGFGAAEARRHRQSGVSFAMFLGLMKCYRQSYLDLVAQKNTAKVKTNDYRYFQSLSRKKRNSEKAIQGVFLTPYREWIWR